MKNNIPEFDGASLLQAPAMINWNYSYHCKLNCSHCYSRTWQDGLELDEAEKLVVTDNIIHNQVFSVNFGGGECLLDPFLLNIIEMLSDVGTFTSLSTSAWGFDNGIWSKLKAVGLNRVSVSLDSPSAEYHDAQRGVNGVYHSVMQCIDYCASIELPVVLSTVLTKSNLPLLDELFELAVKHNCQGVDLKRLRLAGNGQGLRDQELDEESEATLFEKMPQWQERYAPLRLHLSYNFLRTPGIDDGCLCGKNLLTIRHNGDLSACTFSPVILGNALKDDIGKIWRNHPVLHKIRQSGHCMGDISEEKI